MKGIFQFCLAMELEPYERKNEFIFMYWIKLFAG
jgi:hypothetical protein